MCLAVYIASDHFLPLVEWNEDQPQFNVVLLNDNELAVKIQFRYQNIVYAGSHERCGCGFFKDGNVGEELAAVQANYDSLVDYLRKVREQGANVEIFSSWEGDQDSTPKYRQALSLAALGSEKFEFKEKAYYEIS